MIRLLLLSCLVVGILAGCDVVPKCTCQIGSEQIEVSEQYTGIEALTGAVGALGSVVVTGGAFSLWYLIKRKKLNSVASNLPDRSNSELSVSSGSHGYNNRSRPPNVYTAGMRDNLFPNVGLKK